MPENHSTNQPDTGNLIVVQKYFANSEIVDVKVVKNNITHVGTLKYELIEDKLKKEGYKWDDQCSNIRTHEDGYESGYIVNDVYRFAT